MRWLLAAAAVAFLVVAGIASVESLSRDRSPRFGFVPLTTSGLRIPDIDDDDRLQAMLSVHAHAYWPDANDRHVSVRDLDQAIGILARDPEPAAASRRRRAVAKLAAYGLEVPRDGEFRLERFRDGIRRLGVTPSFIEDRARELDPGIILHRIELEWLIQNWVSYLTPACPWLGSKPEGGVRDPPPMGWTYTVTVPRGVADVARSFDPQKWDECTTYFQETYLSDLAGPCCPYVGDSTDCSFTADAKGRPPALEPSAAGRPLPWSPLYENYCTSENGKCGQCLSYDCDLAFRNQLCVKTEYDKLVLSDSWAKFASEHRVYYRLANWLRSERLGKESDHEKSPGAGDKIVLDEGEIEILDVPPPAEFGTLIDWSSVSVEKKIAFEDPGLTQEYGQLLKILQDEIGGQIADQACCMIPLEPWSWWPWSESLSIRGDRRAAADAGD